MFPMRTSLSLLLGTALSLLQLAAQTPLRPPSVPLIACDPYFSVWSPADRLTDADTTHWTGKPHRLSSTAVIDGATLRLLGTAPSEAPALPQKSVVVLPTRTVYEFEGNGVALTLTFLTPALPESIDLLSWPVTYVTYSFRATDGREHSVAVSFSASGELAVNTPDQEVVWSKENLPGLTTLKVGSKLQPVLGRRGDDLRIDWGYLYVSAPTPTKATEDERGLRLDFGKVAAKPVSRWLMLAYDDLYSIQYMRSNLRPYWRRNGWEASDLLAAAKARYAELSRRAEAFDAELMADLRRAGGEDYALLGALAYRQCFAAGKFAADANGQPLQFCKENHSNGCISTSDVFYPMAPQFLLFGPSLAKSFLVPFMDYAASPRWKFPFAPHDLGTYPHANGQRYGGGEKTEDNQMPVEESGNLLILMAAVAQMEGHAGFASLYWKQLEQWAEYLRAKGFDPENQLCTDDFAGHLAHNVNLSVKAICGLGAFSRLCDMRGDKAKAAEYRRVAKEFAARWVTEAKDGDHTKLAFDKPGTWSQKYNLVWDRLLGLDLFPASVARTEMDYYKKIQNRYGLPLDNRKEYTKLDWILWTATLTQERSDFDALLKPVMVFINETANRSPLTDWYETKTAKKVGFTARPVVGGVFLQMLYDKAVWAKWAGRDQTKAANWAPMPVAPELREIVPTAQTATYECRYTTEKPADGWQKPDFDAAAWKSGPAGFGRNRTPSATIRTPWLTKNIWVRREFEMPAVPAGADLQLLVHHDEDADIYINGVLAAQLPSFTADYENVPFTPAARAALKPGRNLIAIHCRQTTGGQYIDAGIVQVVPKGR